MSKKIKKDDNNNKSIILAVAVFMIYLMFGIVSFPNQKNIHEFNAFYYIICALFTVLIIVIAYHKELILELKEFLKHPFKNLLKCLGLFTLLFFITTLSNFLIDQLFGWTKLNSDTLIFPNMKSMLVYTIFVLAIYVPFVEGIVFTKVLNKILKNKIIWIIFSGILYGIMQAGLNFTSLLTIVSAIPYVIIGIVVAVMYEKKKNVFFPIFIWIFYYSFQLLIQYLAL